MSESPQNARNIQVLVIRSNLHIQKVVCFLLSRRVDVALKITLDEACAMINFKIFDCVP